MKDTYPQKKIQQIIDELGLMWYILIEYQKIVNLLDNNANQQSKFRTKNEFK